MLLPQCFSCRCLFSLQFHKEARDTQDLLKRMDKEVDQKYKPEFKDMYQMESLIRDLDVSGLYNYSVLLAVGFTLV